MTKDEALDLALEALERMKRFGNTFGYRSWEQNPYEQVCEAIIAIKQALAAPTVQEPVYHLRQFGGVTKEQLDRYIATGDINPQPAPVQGYVSGLDVYLDPADMKPKRYPAAPVQEPVGTYGEIFESMLSLLRTGLQRDQQIYMAMKDKPLYTAPPSARPAIPDALTSADIEEHIEYVAGWNDCRAEMLKGMK